MFAKRFHVLIGLVAVAIFYSGSYAVAEEGEAAVKGAITIKGKPLPSGRIFFFSEDDQFRGAKIKDGTYKMDRVPLGTYTVTIEGENVPLKYSSEEQSSLRVSVEPGENEIVFSLTSD